MEFFHDIRGDRSFGFGIRCFEQLKERSKSFRQSSFIVATIIQESNVSLNCFLGSWKVDFSSNLVIFCFCAAFPLVVIVPPRKYTSCTPKWRLVMLSLRPAFPRHWRTARRILINCSGYLRLCQYRRHIVHLDRL